MAKKNGLSKDEIIRSKRVVGELFKSGKGIMAYPLRCVFLYTKCSEKSGIKFMVSVGKRYHKRAVKRNLIRRRIKEAFRLNKTEFYNNIALVDGFNLDICYIYIGKQEHSYLEIENAIKSANKNVVKKVKNLSEINNDISINIIG